MLPGPTLIKECPHCLKPIKVYTIRSGNTAGAIYWTDGKRFAPMLPEIPWLVKCAKCRGLLWIDAARDLGWLEAKIAKWRKAQEYLEPTETDFLGALAAGLGADAEKQRYLRLQAWWAANDRVRPDPEAPVRWEHSPQARGNMRSLSAELDETDEFERLLKAKLARELGLFEEAERLLSGDYGEHLRPRVKFLQKLTAQRSTTVAQFPDQDD